MHPDVFSDMPITNDNYYYGHGVSAGSHGYIVAEVHGTAGRGDKNCFFKTTIILLL